MRPDYDCSPMITNIYSDLPLGAQEEQVVELLARAGVRIERIVSNGQASPPGFWYEQPQTEWVLLLQGEAQLRFEDEPAPRVLKPGDFVEIAPRRRHRVEFTHPHLPTVWLAVHCNY